MGFRELGKRSCDLLASKIKGKNSRSICMDMLMVDVTEIDCTEGDRNYFFENQVFLPLKNSIQYL
jgi:alanine racemase